ncbi:hypothetical protein M569_17409, partial [Genlisea aurea]
SASDEFLDQILGFPGYGPGGDPDSETGAMMLQLGSGDASSPHLGVISAGVGVGMGAAYGGGGFPLGLSLDPRKSAGGGYGDASGSGKRFGQGFHAPSMAANPVVVPPPPPAPHPPQMRPRVRARRGQATDPHSIAERLRRERIAEKIRALQELVPTVNKTDRAAMLDEIVDYVKFLRLQVKVLSMSRLGGAGAVAPLVTDIPISSSSSSIEGGAWEKWSSDGTERQVAKLMEENVGAAMQLLQSKALCIMPVSLASAIYHHHHHAHPPPPPESSSSITNPEFNPPP